MKKNIIKKTVAIVILAVIIMLYIPSTSLGLSWSEIKAKASGFISKGSQSTVIDPSSVAEPASNIASLLLTVASGIFVICAIVMGIKYMTTSPDGKGKLKQQAIGLVVAIVVTYGAIGIWQLIINFMNEVVA